jgi:glycosyltransferase involved in cell wall biosynthesis
LRSFSIDDPVSLVVKTGRMGPRSAAAAESTATETLVAELAEFYPRAANVVLIDDGLTAAEIELLHAAGDCYLSLTHSEGWGLGVFEAAAAGNPVIITGWGGQLDFLGSEWPYLIEYQMTPVMDARGRGSYLPTQRWAAPSMDHAVHLIREVYTHPDRARRHGDVLCRYIAESFNERVVGGRLVDLIRTPV